MESPPKARAPKLPALAPLTAVAPESLNAPSAATETLFFNPFAGKGLLSADLHTPAAAVAPPAAVEAPAARTSSIPPTGADDRVAMSIRDAGKPTMLPEERVEAVTVEELAEVQQDGADHRGDDDALQPKAADKSPAPEQGKMLIAVLDHLAQGHVATERLEALSESMLGMLDEKELRKALDTPAHVLSLLFEATDDASDFVHEVAIRRTLSSLGGGVYLDAKFDEAGARKADDAQRPSKLLEKLELPEAELRKLALHPDRLPEQVRHARSSIASVITSRAHPPDALRTRRAPRRGRRSRSRLRPPRTR